MIQSKNALVVVAISALGLAGWKGQDPAEPGDVASAPAEKSTTLPPPAAKPATPPQQFVLTTDGRLFEGVVTEEPDENKVVVTMPIGQMKFPERKIERVFASIQEVHLYKCDQVPEDDIDEQVRLAQWCLKMKLPAEARQHLEQVLNLAPKHQQATAMRAALVMDEARLARRQQMDTDVQKTGGEEVDPGGPAPLNMAVVRGARLMGVGGLPVIFDLPPNAANKRFREFTEGVHPVLQVYCARCHNERYDGNFQLIDTRKKADQTPDALRANLDAVLRLVDRENAGRSELLASTLRPHSKGTSRPIFQGSNDRAYRILEAWVRNLQVRPSPAAAIVAKPPRSVAPSAGDEVFAADRNRITRSTVEVDPITGPGVSAPPPAHQHYETPTMRFQPGQGWTEDKSGGADAPVPFAVSGVMPQMPKRSADGETQPAAATVPAAAAPSPSPSNPRLPDAIARAQAEAEARLAGGAPPLPVDEKGRSVANGKSSKAPKLDPALLQKTLQQKNAAE